MGDLDVVATDERVLGQPEVRQVTSPVPDTVTARTSTAGFDSR